MQIQLAYGRTGLVAEIPDRYFVRELAYRRAEPLADPEAVVAQSLQDPIGSPSLAHIAEGKRSACILICDITRPVPNQLLLEPILKTLSDAGIAREAVTILIATGLHRASTEAERLEMLGSEILAQYRVEDHDGTSTDGHTYLGDSPRGVPIWIDDRYLHAEVKIATGLIEPHFMAGFSGGRKLICPGIAAIDTIKVWHGPEFLEHPKADIGQLEGNPVHEENTWIAQKAGCDFIVNVVIDDRHSVVHLVAGDMVEAFEEGVQFVRQLVTDYVEEPVDVVVTSSAGYPLDTTFYQSVKGMVGAMPIVKPGGTIVVAASLTEGIGSPPFQELFEENQSLDQFMDRILNQGYFKMDQWQLEELAKVRRHARVVMVSDGMESDVLDRLFVESSPSVEAALSECATEYGESMTVAAIPKGPYVIASVG